MGGFWVYRQIGLSELSFRLRANNRNVQGNVMWAGK